MRIYLSIQSKISSKKFKAHLGLSFDGDADRIIMCDENGKIDGDQYCNACKKVEIKKDFKRRSCRNSYVKLWFRKVFKKEKIKFVRSKVGDRYVKEKWEN